MDNTKDLGQRLAVAEHEHMRHALRVLGLVMVVVGGILLVVGLADFFSAFGTFEVPDKFWCAFIGIPMLGGGFGILWFAYQGAINRFVAEENAPVAKDVLNYMGEHTQPGVRAFSRAVADGIHDSKDRHDDHCDGK